MEKKNTIFNEYAVVYRNQGKLKLSDDYILFVKIVSSFLDF